MFILMSILFLVITVTLWQILKIRVSKSCPVKSLSGERCFAVWGSEFYLPDNKVEGKSLCYMLSSVVYMYTPYTCRYIHGIHVHTHTNK